MRLLGDPLPDPIAEAAITAMVNVTVPSEPFPFTKRRALQEGLRQIVELRDAEISD